MEKRWSSSKSDEDDDENRQDCALLKAHPVCANSGEDINNSTIRKHESRFPNDVFDSNLKQTHSETVDVDSYCKTENQGHESAHERFYSLSNTESDGSKYKPLTELPFSPINQAEHERGKW